MKLKDNEARMDDELDAVIKLLAKDFPGTEDYNVEDEEVRLFDAEGNVFKIISTLVFESYWAAMESDFDYTQYVEIGEENAITT